MRPVSFTVLLAFSTTLCALGTAHSQEPGEAVVNEPPEQLSCPTLDLPRLVHRAGIEGQVLLEFVVGKTGRAEPGSIRVISSTNPAAGGLAIRFVRNCLFRPGHVAGTPVRTRTRMPINFGRAGSDFLAVMKLLEKGEQLAKQGRITDALTAYSEAQARDSTLTVGAWSWITLCWAGTVWERVADVMAACEAAVALPLDQADHVLMRDRRGVARVLTGNLEGAIADFEAVVAWSPDDQAREVARSRIDALHAGRNPFTPEWLAGTHVSLGLNIMGYHSLFGQFGSPDVPTALRHFEKATSLDPRNATAQNHLGATYQRLARFAEAVEAFQAAYALDPSLLATLNLGDGYLFVGDIEAALMWHTEAKRTATAERLEDESYIGGAWHSYYLPLQHGDLETIRHSFSVEGVDEKLAFVHYALSFDHALTGDLAAANVEFAAARKLASEARFRCRFANHIMAIESFLDVGGEARKWLELKRRGLREGIECPK